MQRWRKGREGVGDKKAEEGGGESVSKGRRRRRGDETHMLRKEASQN